MNELFRTIAKKILSLTKGVLSGAAISILPVALIHHRHINEYFQTLNWTLTGFFAICVFTGIVVYLRLSSTPKDIHWGLGFFYLFCYTACAALCQKIALTLLYTTPYGEINSNLSTIPEWITVLGLVLISLAAILQLRATIPNLHSIVNTQTPAAASKTTLKHPFYESWLLFMAGVALLFGVWLPLLALPGALIFFKWVN